MRGETFEHTTFEVSFLKNKFNNMFFSFTRNRKAVNFILRKEEGKESSYKILSLLHPQQKLQGTAKEKYQFSKCVKQIIKVSAPNDYKKKKSQFVSIKKKTRFLTVFHILFALSIREQFVEILFLSLLFFSSYTAFSRFFPLLPFPII